MKAGVCFTDGRQYRQEKGVRPYDPCVFEQLGERILNLPKEERLVV